MNPPFRVMLALSVTAAAVGTFPRSALSQPTQMSEAQFAADTLARLQATSFADGVEYCGFVGIDRAASLVATPAVRGTHAGCTLPLYPAATQITASYHTNAGYDVAYNSEIPSALDMDTDRLNHTNGYVATPGGRLWFIDTARATTCQLCATPCLPRDLRHREPQTPVALAYSCADLVKLR